MHFDGRTCTVPAEKLGTGDWWPEQHIPFSKTQVAVRKPVVILPLRPPVTCANLFPLGLYFQDIDTATTSKALISKKKTNALFMRDIDAVN